MSPPRFAPGVRLHEDRARERTVVMAPERLFVPDETALAVLRLVDGVRGQAAIVAALAEQYDTPAEVIAPDVEALLADLAARGAILR